MIANCTVQSLKSINFGYGFQGHNKTLKLRFGMNNAIETFNKIPKPYHQFFSIAITENKKGRYVHMSCLAPNTSPIWGSITRAISKNKIAVLKSKIAEEETKMKSFEEPITSPMITLGDF